MKRSIITSAIVVLCSAFTAFAQSSLDDAVNERVERAAVSGAEMGSLVCEDASGNRVLCSGSVEETVLGIVTNTPYITLNKPSTPEGSRYIFMALVDSNGQDLAEGSYLKAGKNGRLEPTTEMVDAYAVALESLNGSGKIRVKLLKK